MPTPAHTGPLDACDCDPAASANGRIWHPDPKALPWAGQFAGDADPARTAEVGTAIWREIEVALVPVIGPRGMVALYQRSLHLTATSHPWLPVPQDEALAMDLLALKTSVAQQAGVEARRGSSTLLHTFCELLGSLIGDALARRLLGSLWEPSQEPS